MTDENENIETPDTLTEAEAQKRSSSILGKLRKVVNKHTVAIVAVGALATEKADAQGEFHYSESSGLTYTEASVPQSAPRHSPGYTITLQQAATSQNYQKIFNDLPAYAKQRVIDLGMQDRIITRYNTATGLNRPQDGIIYACAIPDPAIPGNVMFIPVEEVLYKAGQTEPTPIPTISVPAQDAEIMMTRPNQRNFSHSRDGTTKTYSQKDSPMFNHKEYMDTLPNGIKILRTENYLRDQLAREQSKAATGGLRRTNEGARRVIHEIDEAHRNVKKAERTVKDIGRTIGRLGRW